MNTPEHSAAPDIVCRPPPPPAGLCRWCWLPEHHLRDLPGRIKCLSNQLHTLPKQAPSACKEKLKHKSCRLLKALCNLHSFRCLGWTPWYFLLPSVQNQQTQGSPQLFKQVSLFSFPSCFAVRLIINAILWFPRSQISFRNTRRPIWLLHLSFCPRICSSTYTEGWFPPVLFERLSTSATLVSSSTGLTMYCKHPVILQATLGRPSAQKVSEGGGGEESCIMSMPSVLPCLIIEG